MIWMGVLLSISALFIIGMLGYIYVIGDVVERLYLPMTQAALDIKVNTALAHLWLEEVISGDQEESIEVVWQHLDSA